MMRVIAVRVLRCVAAAVSLAAAGCASLMPSPVPEFYAAVEPHARCARLLDRVDDAVAAAGVGDGMHARIPGFPHLRANRFLASFADDELNAPQVADWIDRLARLGEQAYAAELANLPAAARTGLDAEGAIGARAETVVAAVSYCTRTLAAADKASAARIGALRAAVRVPDDYSTWQRVVGLYWLTRIPFAHGVRLWQEGVRAVFERPLFMLPVTGERVRYVPPPLHAIDVAAVLRRARENPLGIPDPQGDALDALFRLFAPEFMVDAATDADSPGTPGWHGGAVPTVDGTRPVVYRRVSHTRYRGEVLLQLNYALWFPARPLTSAWDILGGHLDAVLWRVTLTPDGEPWVYDSMHHCGCYHQFFPTARAVERRQPETMDESMFAPQRLPALDAGVRISLRLESGTHYVQRVVVGEAVSASRHVRYAFAEDDDLRSLPDGAGRRSLFRPDGIVPGTERAERYLFWPMGIPEPGAMRQWGRHSTAFVGRRHFDDPDLFEKYFEMRAP